MNREQQEKRLRRLLAEDGAGEDEAAAVEALFSALQVDAPVPDVGVQHALMTRLLAEMPPVPLSWWERVSQAWPVLLMRSQVWVVRREIWAASLFMLALGVMVTLATGVPQGGALLPFTVLAPIVAAVGVALLYDSDMEAIQELEAATPASARLLLLTRLALVFAFDLVLALIGSVLLAVLNAEILLLPLVLSWLAPMTFLSALAFALTVILGDSLVGVFAGLILWGLHVVMRTMTEITPALQLLSLPGLSSPDFRPVLLLAGALLVGLALWMFDYERAREGRTG